LRLFIYLFKYTCTVTSSVQLCVSLDNEGGQSAAGGWLAESAWTEYLWQSTHSDDDVQRSSSFSTVWHHTVPAAETSHSASLVRLLLRLLNF